MFEPVSIAKLPLSTLGPSSDSVSVVKAVIESKRLYSIGAKQFGLDERLPEPQLNALGYNVLQSLRKPGLAVWVFRQNVDMYPESANAHDSLGDGYVAQGDTTAAITQFRRAVDIAQRTGHRVLQDSKRKLTALEARQAARPKF